MVRWPLSINAIKLQNFVVKTNMNFVVDTKTWLKKYTLRCLLKSNPQKRLVFHIVIQSKVKIYVIGHAQSYQYTCLVVSGIKPIHVVNVSYFNSIWRSSLRLTLRLKLTVWIGSLFHTFQKKIGFWAWRLRFWFI